MIIWLASYPRSGNTLFRILLNRLRGVHSYSVYNDRIFEERPEVADVVGHMHAGASIEQMANSPEIFVVKTHDLPGEDDYPAVYLVRDGRDALVSYAHFARDFESSEAPRDFVSTLRDLVVSTDAFGGWGANVLGWVQRRRGPTAVVKFEDLLADPVLTMDRALAQLPLEPRADGATGVMPSFDELQQQLPQFFRRGRTGVWRNEMPPEIQQLFWDKHAQAMDVMGYPRT